MNKLIYWSPYIPFVGIVAVFSTERDLCIHDSVNHWVASAFLQGIFLSVIVFVLTAL